MTRKTWQEQIFEPVLQEKEIDDSDKLWTRRSALALTSGFLAASTVPGKAAVFTHKVQPVADHVVVSKRNRVLAVMNGNKTLKKYRINLGFEPNGHKSSYGDGRTPEGQYYINRRNPRSDFHLSLGISYPNATDIARAMARGIDPGGDIFIHGGPTRSADRRRKDWTAGCIAVTDREIEEIWAMVPTGVPITLLG